MDFPEFEEIEESGVNFFFEETDFEIKNQDAIADWVVQTTSEEGCVFHHCSYIFCNDEYLHKINVEYLEHDDYTDVITFPYSEDRIEGEIYISVDRVKDNAVLLGIPFENELHRVMIHGMLHLCGYTDKTPEDKSAMTAKENFYLSKLQV
ncbi:MAG: rRNA maturation RNase YbeY [Saprospiraceae bacterium]